MRAALYHRVSTTDQDPSLARRELRAAARARGYRIVLQIEETGSGARNDRPGLRRIMEAARRGRIGAVLVWKLDRFGRSALDLHANVLALADAGVRFEAVTQGLRMDPLRSDPMAQLLLTVLSGIAAFERDIISERTRLGMAQARRAGHHLGRPPRVALDPRRVRALHRGGKTWRQIADALGCTAPAARWAAGKGVRQPRSQTRVIPGAARP